MKDIYRPVIWSRSELEEVLACEVPVSGDYPGCVITSVDVDPVRCEPGSLFVAARYPDSPEAQDREIKRATEYGAVAAIAGKEASLSSRIPVVRVDSMRGALRALALHSRKRMSAQVVSITGSVGKTTTKDMVAHALVHQGVCYATKGNYNGNVGFPAALASVPEQADYAILEMSAARKGAIARRARGARASIGVITNIGASHIGYFSGELDILREKLNSLDYLEGCRTAIVGRQVIELDKSGENLLATKGVDRLISVGEADDDDVQVLSVEESPTSVRAKIRVLGEVYQTVIPLAGRHFAENAAFCAAIAHALGADVQLALDSISTFSSGSGRAARWKVDLYGEGRAVEVIEDCQNSSPKSVEAVLSYVSGRNPKRKVLFFGDILELGAGAEKVHEAFAGSIESAGIDHLITVGPLSARLAGVLDGRMEVSSYSDVGKLRSDLPNLLREGDLVILKGSHGIKLSRVLSEISLSGRFASRAGNYWIVEG